MKKLTTSLTAIGSFFKLPLLPALSVRQQCKIRNSTKEEELISGMGDIFIKLSK